jgi:hypothetical protein
MVQLASELIIIVSQDIVDEWGMDMSVAKPPAPVVHSFQARVR